MNQVSLFLRKIFHPLPGDALQKNNKNNFHLLVANVKNYVFIVLNLEGTVVSWNTGAEIILGYSAKEVIGKPSSIFYNTEDVRSGLPLHNLAMAKQNGHHEKNGWRLRKNGERFWASAGFTALKDDKGKLYGYLIIGSDLTATRKAQEQLELFSAQIDQSNDSIFTVDTSLAITSWNIGAQKLYGYTKEEALGKIPNELLHTAISKKDLAVALKQIEETGNWSGELKRKTKAGNYIYVRSSTSNLKNAAGFFCGYIGVSFDITSQKKLQEQLNHFTNIVEQSTDAIRSTGLDHRIITWNKGAETLYGYTKEEAIGRTSLELDIIRRSVAQAEAFFKQIHREGSVKTEVEFFHRNGSSFYGSVTASVVKNEEGQVNSLVFIVKDISDHKQLELQLKKSNEELELKVKTRTEEIYKRENRFRALVENNHSIITLFDKDFVPLYRSPAAERITGWTQRDRETYTILEQIHPDQRPQLAELTGKVLAHPGIPFHFTTRSLHKKGHYIWLQGVVTNMINDPGVGGIISNLTDITERKIAEEESRKNEILYRNLFENILNGFAYCKAIAENGKLTDFIFISVNAEYEAMTGFKNANGRKMSEVRPGVFGSNKNHVDIISRVVSSGKPQKFEAFVEALNKWYAVSIYSPAKEHFVMLTDDITERKHTEESIRKSEVLYRSLFENMFHGFAYCKPVFEDGRLTDIIFLAVNSEYETMHGFKNITGKKLSVIMPGLLDADPAYVIRISKVLLSGFPQKFESHVQHIDKWFFSSIYTTDKEHFVILVENITERKHAEVAIQKSELMYRSLFENMLHGFAYCKGIFEEGRLKDMLYLAVNSEYESMHGFKNIKGEKVSSVMPGLFELFPQYTSILEKVALSGYPEKFEAHAEPLGKWFSSSVYSPEREYFVILEDDITERKLSEQKIIKLNEELEERVTARTEQLKKINDELEAFSYSVSHDLRAPLRGIMGFTSILEDEYIHALDEEAKRITSVIKMNAVRMGHLIDDLLSFSRTGRQDIIKTNFDSRKMVEEVIQEIELLKVEKQNTRWVVHNLPPVYADINTIRQVWVNLISNAVKYSGKTARPRIEIGSSVQHNEIVFYIKDNGTGFDEKYKDKLFRVFQRLHNQDEYEGTGIGLAIVEKIISKHNGKVWAEAKIGKGASFYFSIPAKTKSKN